MTKKSDFEKKIDRLFHVFNTPKSDELKEWILDAHKEALQDIIGDDVDLNTFEEVDDPPVLLSHMQAYECSYVDSFARNHEHQKQRERAGLTSAAPDDYNYEGIGGNWNSP